MFLRILKNIIKKGLDFLYYYFFVIRNRNIDYFNYNKLAVNFPIFSMSNASGLIGNKCYGNLKAIKKALGKEFDKKCLIEHGLYFGEFVIKEECQIKGLRTIYTYGNYRLDALKKSGIKELESIKLVSVGPYILYARDFYNKAKKQKIKDKYGKILLVFPFHTSPELETSFDKKAFINEINNVKNIYNYDTVFTSLFWLDIVNDNYKIFKDEGYVVVCSGVRNDPYFLERQKDLINLSAMTMSNEIGTHIGYCIALNKPHYLYKQEVEIIKYNHKQNEHNDIRKQKVDIERKEFLQVFGTPEPFITVEQRLITEHYWGKPFLIRDSI